jgi:hypothetical protein
MILDRFYRDDFVEYRLVKVGDDCYRIMVDGDILVQFDTIEEARPRFNKLKIKHLGEQS